MTASQDESSSKSVVAVARPSRNDFAIRSWPNLTRVGGRSAVGGGRGGHYTQRAYRGLVAYARQRFVEALRIAPQNDRALAGMEALRR